MIGLGESDTENRAVEAVEKALNNPLLDVEIEDASGALVNVSGGTDVTIRECQEIVEAVSAKISGDAKIIWGAQISKELGDMVRALLIVTGVKTPDAYAYGEKVFTKEKQNQIEKILGIDFV
jgi:cell division protein FtsZ